MLQKGATYDKLKCVKRCKKRLIVIKKNESKNIIYFIVYFIVYFRRVAQLVSAHDR